MTTRRDFLRAGLVTTAVLVLPDEGFVRRFFPVGIDLRGPVKHALPSGLAWDGRFARISSSTLIVNRIGEVTVPAVASPGVIVTFPWRLA